MKRIGQYVNGNYSVVLLEDGTKIRRTEEEEFIAEFPESFDCKITNQCDMGCVMCHENSTKEGLHGDILNQDFINTLNPYTEIAIGGGNPLAHPDLDAFLEKLKERKVMASMTVNQYHFMKNIDRLKGLVERKLIWGLGVSLMHVDEEFVNELKGFNNAVLHIINGMFRQEDVEILKDNNLKVLILGYKEFRRGKDNYINHKDTIDKHKTWLKENIESMFKWFKVVSFDNLAIEQLELNKVITGDQWDRFYMGDDGTKTLYVDMVEKKFARCSTSNNRYEIKNNMQDMFNTILNEER